MNQCKLGSVWPFGLRATWLRMVGGSIARIHLVYRDLLTWILLKFTLANHHCYHHQYHHHHYGFRSVTPEVNPVPDPRIFLNKRIVNTVRMMMILITVMMIIFKNMMMMMMICRREVKNGEALLPSWSTWRGSTLCTRFRSQRSWWPWWWWWWWHWFSIVWHCRWRMMMARWFRSESSTVTLKEISTWRRKQWFKDDYRWL